MDNTLLLAHSVLNIAFIILLFIALGVVVIRHGARPWLVLAISSFSLLALIFCSAEYLNTVLYCTGNELGRYTNFNCRLKLLIDSCVESGDARGFPWPFAEFILEFAIWWLLSFGMVLLHRRIAIHRHRI